MRHSKETQKVCSEGENENKMLEWGKNIEKTIHFELTSDLILEAFSFQESQYIGEERFSKDYT